MLAPVNFVNSGVKDRDAQKNARRRATKDEGKRPPRQTSPKIKDGEHLDVTA